jgi:hypothetical protein
MVGISVFILVWYLSLKSSWLDLKSMFNGKKALWIQKDFRFGYFNNLRYVGGWMEQKSP